MLHRVRLRLTTLMAALVLLLVAGVAIAGPFEDAEAARDRGDYVPRDLDAAQMWFKRAAGNPAADQGTRDDPNYNGNLITRIGRGFGPLEYLKLAGNLHMLAVHRYGEGFTDKYVSERRAMLLEAIKKSMNGTCNIDVPTKKYGKFCDRLQTDDAADRRYMEWIRCIQAADRTCNGP